MLIPPIPWTMMRPIVLIVDVIWTRMGFFIIMLLLFFNFIFKFSCKLYKLSMYFCWCPFFHFFKWQYSPQFIAPFFFDDLAPWLSDPLGLALEDTFLLVLESTKSHLIQTSLRASIDQIKMGDFDGLLPSPDPVPGPCFLIHVLDVPVVIYVPQLLPSGNNFSWCV